MAVRHGCERASQAYLTRLEVDMGSVFESEPGQKLKYGALKTVYVVSSEKNLGFKGFELVKAIVMMFDFPLLTTYNFKSGVRITGIPYFVAFRNVFKLGIGERGGGGGGRQGHRKEGGINRTSTYI